MPPRIGIVVSVNGSQLVVRLRLGTARHWCHRPRRCTLENVVRLANPREIVLGMPVGEVPKVTRGRSLSRAEIAVLYPQADESRRLAR